MINTTEMTDDFFLNMSDSTYETIMTTSFPSLYSDIIQNLDETQSCMAFGFEIPVGWRKLVYQLSEKLEPMVIEENKIKTEDWVCKAAQVKSKFAGLRFYMHGGTDEMYDLINKAEDESESMCEVCGKTGIVYRSGWHVVLCDQHAKEKNKVQT
jgi:hypothetical protein